MSIQGYTWFGHNRLRISHRASRGSGGVGILVNSNILVDYDVAILDTQMEGILWVKLTINYHPKIYVCVYVTFHHASLSSRGDSSEEFFDCLQHKSQCTEILVQFAYAGILTLDVATCKTWAWTV